MTSQDFPANDALRVTVRCLSNMRASARFCIFGGGRGSILVPLSSSPWHHSASRMPLAGSGAWWDEDGGSSRRLRPPTRAEVRGTASDMACIDPNIRPIPPWSSSRFVTTRRARCRGICCGAPAVGAVKAACDAGQMGTSAVRRSPKIWPQIAAFGGAPRTQNGRSSAYVEPRLSRMTRGSNPVVARWHDRPVIWLQPLRHQGAA
jgi:hypothetical protein